MRNRKIITCFILFAVVSCSFLAYKILGHSEYEQYEKPIFPHQNEMKHFTNEDDKQYSSIFYPSFKQPKLNEAIQRTIKEKTTYRTKEKYIHYTDYEIFRPFPEYISIKFHHFIYTNKHKKLVEQIQVINYDEKADKILNIEDVLRKDYKNLITTQIAKNKKDYKVDNMSDFVIQKKEIEVYFHHENIKKINIPYKQFPSYITLKNKKINSLYQKQVHKQKVDKIYPDKPMVSFTFDDGPSLKYTEQIMKAFQKVNGSATFFMLGSRAKQYPEIVKEVYSKGFEVANHTLNHKNLQNIKEEEVYHEIMETQDILYRINGVDPTLLRPPYGSLPKGDLQDYNLDVALWSVDTLDWQSKNSSQIQSKILENIKDGSIILMHDIYKTSAQTVENILPILKEQGYQFVSMSELIKYRYTK